MINQTPDPYSKYKRRIKIGKSNSHSHTERRLKQYQQTSPNAYIVKEWKHRKNLESDLLKVISKFRGKSKSQEAGREVFDIDEDELDDFIEHYDNVFDTIIYADGLLVEDHKVTIESEKETEKKVDQKISRKKKKSLEYTGTKPKTLIFKNKSYDVDSWRDVFIIVSEQIYNEVEDFSIVEKIKGRKRTYFSKNPEIPFQPKKIPNTNYYLDINLSANSIMIIIQEMLELFNYKKTDFKVVYQ
jgi:negative regulator of replication initiation